MKLENSSSNLRISRILHAGYVFQYEDCQIVFDPIFENPFSKNCYAFPGVRFDFEAIKKLKFNAVFISHFHDDHCSFDSLNLIDKKTPIYIYCFHEKLFTLIIDLGFISVHKLDINVSIKVENFKITPRKALESEVDCIFQIEVNGLQILNMVDSWMDLSTLDVLADYAPWDLVLWPFQVLREIQVLSPVRFKNENTEIPFEWIEQLKVLNPKYVIPSSCQFLHEDWSWYNSWLFPISYKTFREKIEFEISNIKVFRLDPSCSILLTKNSLQQSGALNWVIPIGPQDLDYKFSTEVNPPSCSDVARKFPSLTTAQTEVVLDFCRTELANNYSKNNINEENFFYHERIWKLIVYNNDGLALVFYYKVYRNQIKLYDGPEASFSWLTEISAYKLYSAIVLGETLTSLYMRVNDCIFEPSAESEFANADIMNDPLIQSLFHDRLFSYQEEQLKKIKAVSS